jgi:hypothetical protein
VYLAITTIGGDNMSEEEVVQATEEESTEESVEETAEDEA